MSKGNSSQKSLRQAFFSSPLVVVFTVATLVVFASSLAGYVRRGGFWSPEVEARVYNQAGRSRDSDDAAAAGSRRIFAFQGEVYQRAERLREAAALAMATTLVGAQASAEGRPASSVEALLKSVSDAGAMPPGMAIGQGGSVVASPSGIYYVRYRVEPLGVEVLSVGQGNTPGPPLLVRLPDDDFAQNSLTYYVAPKNDGVESPQAFAPLAEIFKLGWVPETFKAAPVSPEEATRQREWLEARPGN